MLYIDMSHDRQRFQDPVVPEALAEYLQTAPQYKGKELLYFYHPEVPTVIVGHYQDVYHEVNFPYLREKQIDLVRRNSGGGAVFIDPGDLTYVYIDTAPKVKTPKFNLYISPILLALKELGINAEQTGRNDLTVDGKKFSGMSFSQIKDRVLYGGTLMLNVNLEEANRVLTPSKSKLEDKGIESVRSRVTNLKDYINIPSFTTNDLRDLILKHVKEENKDFKATRLSEQEWADIIELGHRKFGTKEWIYGSNLAHYYVDSYFHGIGSIGIAFNVKNYRLADVKIYGDLMVISQKVAEQLQKELDGCPIVQDEIKQILIKYDLDGSIKSGTASQLANEIINEAANENTTN